MNPPSALHGAMGRDRKPFTYTPGGLDLSEIKSERMAARLMRNAMNQGVPELPQHHIPSPPMPSTPIAVPNFNCLPVQVFPTFNLPANPKSLLRTRSNPGQPRELPAPRVAPPATPQFVNNSRLSGATQYEPTKKTTAPYSQPSNNRPVSMYEFGTPANTMNYGSNGYTPTIPDNNLNLEYLQKPKVNINDVFKSVASPVDAFTNYNSKNDWKDNVNAERCEQTFQPFEPTNKSPELVEDFLQSQQSTKETATPIEINIDKPIEKLMEAFERIDNILGKTELKSKENIKDNVLDVDNISSNIANNPEVITENQPTEDLIGLSKEKKEVKVVQKHLIKKENDTEEQNGSNEQNGNTEIQAIIKLPSKKSAAKTETKVEVLKKTLPDGSTEEVKKSITKTTIDGRTEIRTKTETTIIPKEDDDEEIEEAEEEGDENSETQDTETVVEEKETVVKKSTEEEKPKENSQDSNIIKTEEKSETTTTTSKKVTVVQDDQDDSQEEEEDVEEEETEEVEPVTVTSKTTEVKQVSKETSLVKESQDEVEKEEVESEEVKESEATVEIEELEEKPANVISNEEDEEENEQEEVEKQTETENENEDETDTDETRIKKQHQTEQNEPEIKKIESQSETIEPQSEDAQLKENEEEEGEEEEEYEEADQETDEKVIDTMKPEERKDDESSKEVDDVVESKEEDQEVTSEEAQAENSCKNDDKNDNKLEQSQQVVEEKQEIIVEKEEIKLEKQEVPEEKLEPKVIKIEVQEQKVPLREPSVPLEKVEDVEIKPIGAGDFMTKTHTENTEIITNVTERPTGLLTEFNRVENIVTVNRTIKTLDHQEIPTMKTYISPHDRIPPSPQTSLYQPAYTQQPTERRHSLLLERLSVERQMPAEIYQNNYQQTTQTIEQQRQWSQEPQAEVLTVSNVKPSQITNQQWYQQRENSVINSSTPSQPATLSWTQPKAQPQPIYQPQSQYRVPTPQPQYRAPTPQPQPQPQQEHQPSYMENVQENSYQNTYSSYTPKPRSASSTRAVSPIPTITTPTPQNQYSYVNKDSSESYLKTNQNYTSSSYVPPPWEQDASFVPPDIQQNVYQPPQVNAYTAAPAQSWTPAPPAVNKFSKPKPSSYIPPKPNQSFVANVTSVEPPKLPGRKTYYSEYERRYITVPESTYIPGETKFQPQPDPSPKYYYDNNEPAETVEPEWRKELREFTEKSQTQTETNVKPPWEHNQGAKVPEQQTPTWSQTVRPQSWRERSFESEYVSQEWPKANTLGRGRPLTSYAKETISERTRGVSVDRYNPNNYHAPLAAEHPPVPTHTHVPPPPIASGYHNPNVPAYHARASAEPREHVNHPVPRPKEARASPFQSRSFKYLQWITGTED